MRQLPITHRKENAWKNTVASSINSNRIIEGDGISVNYSPYGTNIKLDVIDDNPILVWAGDFDINKEYYPNQVVRVNVNTRYYVSNSADIIPFGSTNDYGYETTPISPGLFVCNAYIPAGACTSDWFFFYVAPQYNNSVPFEVINGVRWYDLNVYYPIYPPIPTEHTSSVIVTGNNAVVANSNFWTAMPMGSISTNICHNDRMGTFYMVGEESGSSFKTMYLPYQPTDFVDASISSSADGCCECRYH